MDYMSEVTLKSGDAERGVEERNLLSVAFKNVIGARRASWRIVSSIETKEEAKHSKESEKFKLIAAYKANVEAELTEICNRILDLLKNHLEDRCSAGESKVFYKKMKGDYWRYLAEFKGGAERKEAAEETLLAYKSAEATAEADWPRRTQSDSDWRSTFPSFTMKFSTRQSALAKWPRERSTKPSASSTRSVRSPTRTALSSCSCSVTTSLCGLRTWTKTLKPGVRMTKRKSRDFISTTRPDAGALTKTSRNEQQLIRDEIKKQKLVKKSTPSPHIVTSSCRYYSSSSSSSG